MKAWLFEKVSQLKSNFFKTSWRKFQNGKMRRLASFLFLFPMQPHGVLKKFLVQARQRYVLHLRNGRGFEVPILGEKKV
jgi:hypothetical protein